MSEILLRVLKTVCSCRIWGLFFFGGRDLKSVGISNQLSDSHYSNFGNSQMVKKMAKGGPNDVLDDKMYSTLFESLTIF